MEIQKCRFCGSFDKLVHTKKKKEDQKTKTADREPICWKCYSNCKDIDEDIKDRLREFRQKIGVPDWQNDDGKPLHSMKWKI